MKRMDRRKFMLVAAAGGTSAVLVACGNDPDDVDLDPTMIPVEGAPPTLAPMATPGGGASGGGDDSSGGDSGGADEGVVTLEAHDPFNWSTNELEAAPGQTIQITNTGVMEHDFVIDELGIHEVLPSGEPVDVTLPDDLAVGDTYTYYCSIPGHRESGMEGTLTIVEASVAEDAEEVAEGDDAVGTEPDGPVILEAHDPFNWSTNDLQAAPGATIQVTNTGVMEHDFVIDELSIEEALPSGEVVEVTLPGDLAVGDTYTFYCSIPGHRESGMEGTLTIVEASAPAEEAAPADEEAATPSEGEGETVAAGESVKLRAIDPFSWSIVDLQAAPGQTIEITNDGVLEHDFVIDELSISQVLPTGEVVDVALPEDLTPGDTYTFYCSVPGHRESGMVGTLTVIESGTPATNITVPAGSTPVAEDLPSVSDEAAASLEDPAVIALESTDPYNWSRKEISAAPGQIIRVLNRGVLEHDFVIDEFDISQVLPFGEPIDIQVPTDAEIGSTHEYYCSIPGHRERGMVGVLTIVEGDGSVAATPAASPAASPVSETTTGGDAATSVDVSAVELAFEPKEFTIPANTDVTINITNDGVLEHDFAVDDLGIESDLLASGEQTSVVINAAPGTYEFHCTVTGHAQAGMVGTITVE